MPIRLIFFLSAIAIGFILVTLLLNKFFPNKKFIKYLPSLGTVVWGIYFALRSRGASADFEDLAYIMLAMMTFSGGIAGLLTAVVIDYRNRK